MEDDEIKAKMGQLDLPLLHSDVQKTTPDGIEMGVLENGMPYLNQRGLVKMAGIPRTTFQRLSNNWAKEKLSGAGADINTLLLNTEYTEDELFIQIEVNGLTNYAYTEPVCFAILEYYAFDAKKKSETARNGFRILSKAGFRGFVYEQTGYKPQHEKLDSWQHFHDRIDMTMDAVPLGYFSIFREIAQMIVPMIRAGVMISDKVVPDISVGLAWSKFWDTNNLTVKFGERVKYKHSYPLYYPQSKSNPQPAHAYPDTALGEFRKWLRVNYISNKFPNYLLNQSKKGRIEIVVASKAIQSFAPPKIEEKTSFDEKLKQAIEYKSN